MNPIGREHVFLLVPVLLVAALLYAFDAPLAIALPLTALSVLLPALVCLRRQQQAYKALAGERHQAPPPPADAGAASPSLIEAFSQRQRVEAFLQNLIDVIPHPVYVKTATGAYSMVNQAFAKYWNRSRESVVGLRSRDLSADASRAALSEEEDREVIAGAIVSKEQQSRHPITGEEVFRIVNKRRCVAVDGSVVVIGIDHYITEWRVAERQLKQLAEVDALTGLPNRRHFSAEARQALEFEQRYGLGLSLLLLDLDFFKRVNDQHGHNIGDEALRAMSAQMQETFRKSDLPGRWGGEEFIALLPHTGIDMAVQVADRLRVRMADTAIPTPQGPIYVTLSGGCAQWRAGDTLESLVERADAALYRAKKNGRNRIEVCAEGDLPIATYATGAEI